MINKLPPTRYIDVASDGINRWTEDGMYYRELYSLLAKLKVMNSKKVLESLR